MSHLEFLSAFAFFLTEDNLLETLWTSSAAKQYDPISQFFKIYFVTDSLCLGNKGGIEIKSMSVLTFLW